MAAPTPDQENQFRNMIQNGNFAGAASFARGLGFSDAEIAQYVGENNIRDNSGAQVTAEAAQNYLNSAPAPAPVQAPTQPLVQPPPPVQAPAPNTPLPTATMPPVSQPTGLLSPAPQPSAALAQQFATLMNQGNYQGAQNLGLSNGYTNAQIANYVGNLGTFKDANGRTITEANANDFLKSPSQVQTPTTATPTTTTAPPAAQTQQIQAPPAIQQQTPLSSNLGMGPQLKAYEKNPYLDQMAQGITSQVNDNFTRNQAPAIRSGAMAAGGFGGSRQGVVESNALRDINKSLSQDLSALYATDYQNTQNRNLQQYQGDQSYGLGARNSDNQFALGVGGLNMQRYQGDQNYALGNKNSDNSFNLGARGLDNNFTLGARGLDNQYNLGARSLDNQYNANQNNLGLGYAQLDANIYNNNFNNSLNSAQFGLNAYNTLNQNNQAGVNGANNIQQTPLNYQNFFNGQYQGYGGQGGNTSQTGTQGTTSNGAVQGAGLGLAVGKMFYPQQRQ